MNSEVLEIKIYVSVLQST